MPDLYHHQQPQGFNNPHPLQYHQNYQKCGSMTLLFNHHHHHQQGSANRTNNNNNGIRDLKLDERAPSSPLARLAVHTQGAPLILTKPSYRKKSARNNNNNNNKSFDNNSNSKSKPVIVNSNNNNIRGEVNGAGAAADTVSVASDESTGSANSENCLPRIIKPRKRRKKDRKSPPTSNRPNDGGSLTDNSASSDIIDFINNASPPPTLIENLTFDDNLDCSFNKSNSNSLLINGGVEEAPNLHHSFDDVKEASGGSQTTCQCRYCDPSGQIWDVDRNCYSPFLTTQYNTVLNRSYSAPISSDFDSRCLEHSMSSVSLHSNDDTSNWKTISGSGGDLEVSTEIVTSLNGHRDLEIRFFSTASVNSDSNNNSSDSSKMCRFISRNEE